MARVVYQDKTLVEQCDEAAPYLFWEEEEGYFAQAKGYASAEGEGYLVRVTGSRRDGVCITGHSKLNADVDTDNGVVLFKVEGTCNLKEAIKTAMIKLSDEATQINAMLHRFSDHYSE